MRACSDAWSDDLSAWIDGELTADAQAHVEAHLATCAGCAAEAARYRSLGDALRGSADDHVPDRLRARVAGLRPPRSRAIRPGPRPAAARPRIWRVATGLAAAAALLLASLGPSLLPGGLDDALAHEVTLHHYRAFSRAEPCDFTSSDADAVRAWLAERVDHDVHVPEVEGAVLLGARLCRLGGVVTAALLYRVGDEAVTVFVAEEGAPAERAAAAFADADARCVDGRLDDTICVTGAGEGGRFAVAGLDADALRPFLR